MAFGQQVLISKALVLCFVACFAQMTRGLNILAIETIGGLSHWKVMSGVLQILVDQGHNVTAYTPFPEQNVENFTTVDVSEDFVRGIGIPLTVLQINFTSPFDTYAVLRGIGWYMCDKMFEHREIKAAIDRTDFDVVIMEPLWSDCVSYVAAHMNRPLLYVTAFSVVSFKESSVTGGYSNPLVYANVLLPYSAPSTVFQIMENIILFMVDVLFSIIDYFMRIMHSKPYETSAPISPSAVLVNSHVLIEKPRPSASKAVNIGGIHLKEPKPLPADIEEFINNSSNGVIYFAFGATLKMSSIPKETFMAFIAAIEKTDMNVIVKYEEDNNFDPTRVMAKKWLPQRDILVHPNVKLFIHHGGMCGLLEALDAGVPVVGVPIIGDQFRNIDNFVNEGLAVSVPLDTVTEEKIFNSINDVLNNEKYVGNAKNASCIFKESEQSYKKVIANLINHAVNYKGEEAQGYIKWYCLVFLLTIVILFLSRNLIRVHFLPLNYVQYSS